MTFIDWRQFRVAALLCRLVLVGGCLLLVVGPSSAVEVQALYTVEVDRDPTDPDDVRNAEQAALLEVLVRITGTTAITESPEILEIFPNPSQFVLRRQTGPDNTARLTLDGAVIERIVRQSGATIWGSNRPLTLVLMAVDWGRGKRDIVAAVDPVARSRSIDPNRLLRERVEDAATMRGIPVVFPRLDTAEAETLSFTDIWGGFDEPLWQVAERYGADSLLVGRIRPDSQQENRWTWYHSDQRRVWNGEPETAINAQADAMAALYAVGGNAAVEEIRVSIAGVNSVQAYAEVQRLMESLSNVDQLQVKSARADTIHYRVTMQGGAERLDRVLKLSGMLELVEETPRPIDARDYRRNDGPPDNLRGIEPPATNDVQFGVTSVQLQYVLRTD